MMRATTKRASATRAMVMAMRVPGDKEGKGDKGHGIVDKGATKRTMATEARAMVTRVADEQQQ
jgi:hypothetical protein